MEKNSSSDLLHSRISRNSSVTAFGMGIGFLAIVGFSAGGYSEYHRSNPHASHVDVVSYRNAVMGRERVIRDITSPSFSSVPLSFVPEGLEGAASRCYISRSDRSRRVDDLNALREGFDRVIYDFESTSVPVDNYFNFERNRSMGFGYLGGIIGGLTLALGSMVVGLKRDSKIRSNFASLSSN